MFGTIVNTLSIIAGSLIGLLVKGGIPKKYMDTVMQAISLAVVLIGLKGAFKIEKTDDLLVVIFCLALGSLIGEFLKIEDRLNNLGNFFERIFSKTDNDFSKGFVTASLVYCVGAMAIVGSLESGLTGNHETLYAKSSLDGIASIVFASSMGLGVMLASVSVFIYQGIITYFASAIKPFLVPDVIKQMSGVGGLLIMALGFNLLDFKKIKVGNMLPAIFLPFVYFLIKSFGSALL